MRQWVVPLARYVLYAVFAAFVFHQALAVSAETRRLTLDRRKIRIEIAALRRQNEWREEVSKALTSDPFYVERLLRERYGYRGPDEEQPAARPLATQPARSGQPIRQAAPARSQHPAFSATRLAARRTR